MATSTALPTSFTRNTTTGFLAGVAVVQALAALRADVPREAARANALGASVCLIAYWHYERMRTASSDAERILLRYGDWMVTCPLLLLELQAMSGRRHGGGAAAEAGALLGTLLMILLGLAAKRAREPRARAALFGASTLVFLAVAGVTLHRAERHRGLVAAFFGVWALYPMAFLIRDERVGNQTFDVLDAISKGAFGLYVAAAAAAAAGPAPSSASSLF